MNHTKKVSQRKKSSKTKGDVKGTARAAKKIAKRVGRGFKSAAKGVARAGIGVAEMAAAKKLKSALPKKKIKRKKRK